ncbi:hypothetical protein Anapl_12925 [Anas platyrhynchos]|uniref:Uncharacterized protein n=1 Tax=Anas platyrhynchos TaxID=8839 RepID=R0L9A0_ANAPL|nr:hypothetical protein Anapl_12925 [Anas platyrhynchos]
MIIKREIVQQQSHFADRVKGPELLQHRRLCMHGPEVPACCTSCPFGLPQFPSRSLQVVDLGISFENGRGFGFPGGFFSTESILRVTRLFESSTTRSGSPLPTLRPHYTLNPEPGGPVPPLLRLRG